MEPSAAVISRDCRVSTALSLRLALPEHTVFERQDTVENRAQRFPDRVREKQLSRQADRRALASGAVGREQLANDNAFGREGLCRQPLDFRRIRPPR